MKLTRFMKVLDESAVESKASVKETIERLRTMQGGCRQEDTDGYYLEFTCDKKGWIRVGDVYRNRRHDTYNRTYFMLGRVVSENGKTMVKMYGVRQRTNRIWALIDVLVYAVFVVAYFIVKIMYGIPFTMQDGIGALILGIVCGCVYHRLSKETKNHAADFEIMKQEIINRVDAVNRWDE